MNCSRNPKSTARHAFLYNPFEIAFCGQAGSSRSTLVSRLVRSAFTKHVVGQIDNDVPYVGQEGEQAWVYCERTRFQHVLVHPPRKDEYVRQWPLLDADMVFVEEGRDCDLPSIVVLDDLKSARFSNVIAYVGHGASCAGQVSGAPFFQRDSLDEIKEFILEYFRDCVRKQPLYGLVLAGGRSTRMSADKAALQYHGQPQVRQAWELLEPLCGRVFVSTRAEQSEDPAFRGLAQVHDAFLDMGPVGGILSAMRAHPEAAWLVLACDLPLMDAATLERLVERRNPFKLATAYQAPRGGMPEPLCAIYEPKSVFRLFHFLAQGLNCPRKVLINSDAELIQAENSLALTNVNEPREYQEVLATLQGRRKAAP